MVLHLSHESNIDRRRRRQESLELLRHNLASIKYEAAKGAVVDAELVKKLEDQLSRLEQELNDGRSAAA